MNPDLSAYGFKIFLQYYLASLKWIVLPNDFEILDFKVIRLVNKQALQLITTWKLEYPKIPGFQLTSCLNKLQSSTHFSISVDGDYGRYACNVQYQYNTMYMTLDCYGGPKRSQYSYWQSTWIVTKTTVLTIICNNYSCEDFRGHKCDRSLLLLTLRLMHAPLYLLSEFKKTCCIHDSDEGWYHSDYCISCGEDVYYNWEDDDDEVNFNVDEILSTIF